MKHMLKTNKSLIVEIVSCLCILLFVYAATSKLLDFQKFSDQIGQSPILTAFKNWVVIGIPALEYVISLLLLFRTSRLIALYASFGLMVIFSTYIYVITRFSEYVPCSCGGILEKMNWDQHLIFNIAFLLIVIVGIMVYPFGDKLDKV